MSDDAERQLTTRVNSGMLGNYIGQTVRLACKVLTVCYFIVYLDGIKPEFGSDRC